VETVARDGEDLACLLHLRSFRTVFACKKGIGGGGMEYMEVMLKL
jgi:hypothetical protein